jgi:tetratricopeptide (TPR) repeat protein
MKKNNCFFTVTLLILLTLITQTFTQTAQYGFYDKFYTGILDNGLEHNYNNFSGLNLNLWCHYNNWWDPNPNLHGVDNGWTDWEPNDFLLANLSQYSNTISGILSTNSGKNLRTIMDRVKIDRLCYGQRSEYQCEVNNLNPYYNFYAWANHDSNVSQDYTEYPESGATVHGRRSILGVHQSGLVCENLIANREQVNIRPFSHYYTTDKDNNFYIKPRIKIPVGLPDNTEICKIIIYNWNGPSNPNNKILEVTLKARNFKVDNGGNNYLGGYIEEYNFTQDPGTNLIIDNLTAGINKFNPGNIGITEPVCNVDIQVEWLENCDMWIDYVRVDDDVANDLFGTGAAHNTYLEWLQWEADLAESGSDNALKFCVEEFEMNNMPCIAYVNRKLKENSDGKFGLVADINIGEFYWLHRRNLYVGVPQMTPNYIKHTVIDYADLDEFYTFSYPLQGSVGIIPVTDENGRSWPGPSKIPYTLPVSTPNSIGSGILAQSVPVNEYEQWLQGYLDDDELVENFRFTPTMKWADETSRLCNKPFINIVQSHLWCTPNNDQHTSYYMQREPTNEELKMLSYLPVTYGAKGQFYFWWSGWADIGNVNGYGRGFTGSNTSYSGSTLRDDNIYGQWQGGAGTSKMETVGEINNNLNAWSSHLMSFDNTNRRSYIYRLTDERNNCLSETYFNDIKTYPPDNTLSQNPSAVADSPENTYLQASVFKKPDEPRTSYFMIVNRRCSPFRPEINTDGGRRNVKVKFDNNTTWGTWKIFDIGDPAGTPITFNRNNSQFVDLGWFMPGEGKLYKLAPVLVIGGELAGDENILGESFTCEAPVYNNGFNITIGANTTIHFNDSSKFVMNGGVFTVGDQNTSAPQNITSDAVTGNSWRGHSFTNCEVKIYGATFTGLANDTTYAVNIVDCPVVDIRNSTFNTNSSLKGGVNAVFFSDPNNEISLSNIYIGANTFNSSGSTIPTVNISSYAGETTPLIIENNTFNEGNTAIFLSGITGGAIKGNSITDSFIGINALTSSIDIKSNTISSTVNNAIGIFAAGGSELKMNNAGSKTLGGLNDFSNSGTAANNIVVDGSVFLLDGGQNIFNITDDQSSKHLYGYFPQFTQGPFDETNNCFKLNSSPVDPPYNVVTSGFQGSQITFNFTPFLSGCEANESGDGFAINLGDGIYDTIYSEGSGSGGSQKNIPLSRGVTRETGRGVFTISTAKQLYDSISVLMRYRNYTQARTKCLDLINAYPDSIQSMNVVSKLFLSTVASDTSYNAVNELKTYYENLILNHSGNLSLVKRANYYILKCKVRMHEYSQALAGFQQIINENPYSYEGLIARWDYMATSLLIQGQGGAFSSIDNDQLAMSNYDIYGDDEKSPFTKEQRQDIRKSINTAIEISKTEDDRKIKSLEDRSELGDVNASKELTQMLTLKQVIKTDRPKSIIEHVRIVSEDIRKVFGSNTSSKGNETKNIPLVFRLSQNYPNPFNPVTKINYDLPKDSKVKIVIYDILGREVKRLVNSELKTAGSYIVDFNASNFASGVYFYRIEAEEPNGNKFVDSKKMVLLK